MGAVEGGDHWIIGNGDVRAVCDGDGGVNADDGGVNEGNGGVNEDGVD